MTLVVTSTFFLQAKYIMYLCFNIKVTIGNDTVRFFPTTTPLSSRNFFGCLLSERRARKDETDGTGLIS